MSDPSTKCVYRPAICLNMIVRNEAHVVADVLDAVAPYISTWVIVDTGSDDGTQGVIRTHMARLGIPGELHERPWRDFAHNRTEALNLAQGHADYIWVMDADDTIVGTPDFTALNADFYSMSYQSGPDFYRIPRLFRDGLRVRYEGVVHEYAICDDPCVRARLDGDYHIESRRLGARNLDPQKYAHDRDLLLAEVQRDPKDARSVFYLAQSYYLAGDFAHARIWYTRRAEMGGWAEEVFYSLYQVAVSMADLNEPWPPVQDAFLRAWKFRPTRAEPLYAIARRYREEGRYRLGHLFAEFAAQIPFPDEDTLFVRTDVYGWRCIDEQAVCASWTARKPEAFTLWRQLLTQPDVPDDERQRIAGNRDLSAPTMINAAAAYPEPLVQSLPVGPRGTEVVVSLIAGPDRAGTEQTLNSFLHCCTDISRVGRFLAVDAGLSEPDRAILCDRYPFLEFAGAADRSDSQLSHIRSLIDARFWLHLGQGWRFFAPENLITRLTAVLEAEERVVQVAVNYTDAANLTGTSAPEQAVHRAAGTGRYLLTDRVANGPAMFETTRLDRAGGLDPRTELGRRVAAELCIATLDEVLCIATV